MQFDCIKKIRSYFSYFDPLHRIYKVTFILVILFFVLSALTGFWFLKISQDLSLKIQNHTFAKAQEVWAHPDQLELNINLSQDYFFSNLETQWGIKKLVNSSSMGFADKWPERKFVKLISEECAAKIPNVDFDTNNLVCWGLYFPKFPRQLILFDSSNGSNWVHSLIQNNNLWLSVNKIYAPSSQVGLLNNSAALVQQKYTPLSDIPPSCLHAVLAIEDPKFLEHEGISWKALARAFWINIRSGHIRQGGSTLTQQTVKNFFLTSEKTFQRKLIELFYSLALENSVSKDKILETYLNIIYMGSSGSFELRGFGAASEHYFGKNLSDLAPHQCSLLAAILNGPGIYNPFKSPARAMQRRQQVIAKMHEANFITSGQKDLLISMGLSTQNEPPLNESDAYYIKTLQYELKQKKWTIEPIFDVVYTGLKPAFQKIAQTALTKGIEQQRKTYPALEGAAIVVDLSSGMVLAAVGGSRYQLSPFNRITEAKRQIGSLAKPFVFLAALDQISEFNPMTEIMDSPTQINLEIKSGTPKITQKNI